MISYIIGILMLLLIIYGYCSNYTCKVTKHTILVKKTDKNFHGITFAIMSDLHGNSFGKKNNDLIKKIKKARPDAILIPGDMIVKNGKGKEVCFSLLEALGKEYPIYYSPGNHEIKYKEADAFRERIKKIKVHYLENDSILLQKNNQKIKVFGLSLPKEYYKKVWDRRGRLKCKKEVGNKIEEVLGLPEQSKINLLLAHNPEYFPAYEQWGADVVISGHVHGGVMTLWFGGVIAPSLRLFPKYSNGYYKINQTHMYVSRGLGLHHIKLRFFNIPELTILTIQGEIK